jgi:ligand-binding sensor domain-containing protein
MLLLLCLTSCNGQIKTNLPIDSVSKSKTNAIGQLKIIKTQGTGPGANIGSGLQDKAGNLWFGSTGEGVYRYDGKSFTNFTVKDGLNNNYVWCVYEDKTGNLWLGTADGVCRYDGQKFTRVPISGFNVSNFYLNQGGAPSVENAVWDILQDKTGHFWFGTTKGIYRYDGKTFTHFLHNDSVINNTSLQVNSIESILEDKTGDIWFGGRGTEGLFRFDGKSLTSYTPDGKEWVRPILEDKAGNIWFGTRNHSVYRYEGKNFTNFADEELFGWVVSMAEDKDGNLWFSTERGIAKFDGKHITTFTAKDGLGNVDVSSITLDKSGNLWVGTRGMGLYRYDGKTFTNFSE